jgi:hypothetical protein
MAAGGSAGRHATGGADRVTTQIMALVLVVFALLAPAGAVVDDRRFSERQRGTPAAIMSRPSSIRPRSRVQQSNRAGPEHQNVARNRHLRPR